MPKPSEYRDYCWLQSVERGRHTHEIAAREGLSHRTVQLGVARARAYGLQPPEPARKRLSEPKLDPLFPVVPFSPLSVCPHKGPIRPGSRLCCMVCSRSGMDAHPALKRDPRVDPRPEPRPPEVAAAVVGPETRKARRKRLFAPMVPT